MATQSLLKEHWRTVADHLPRESQDYLTECLTITPDVKQGIYPFKDIKLTYDYVAGLMAKYEPIDWHDESQREREGLDLRGAYLQNVDLHDLPLARMRGGLAWNERSDATMEERKLAAAHLEEADLHRTHLEEADLSMAYLEEADLRAAHLERADLSMAHLEGAKLSGADLKEAKLTGASLQKANLRSARLEGADLREAHLEGASLFQADLRGIDLRGAFLQGADLRGALLQGAKLHDAKLDQAYVHEAVITEEQRELLLDRNVIGLGETKDPLDLILLGIEMPSVDSSPQALLADILHKHVELVIAGRPLEETLPQLVQGACMLAKVPENLGTIRVIDPDTLILQRDFLGNSQIVPPIGSYEDNTDLTGGITGRAVVQRREVIVEDVNFDEDYMRADENVCSEMAVPLLIGDRCWGVLNLESYSPDHFHEDLLPWMQILASQAVLTIQYDAQRQRSRLIRTTNDDIDAMLREQDITSMRLAREQALHKLVDAAKVHTGSQSGSIMIAEQTSDGPDHIEKDIQTEIVLPVAQPQSEKLDTAQHSPVSKGLMSEAYRTKQLKVKEVDVHSVELAAPLYVSDQMLGVLSLKSMKARTYSTEQLRWAELIASQIANVLSSAQLYLLRKQLIDLLQIEREMMVESLRDDGGPINRALLQRILRAALNLTEQPDGYASLWLTHGNELRRYEFFTGDESALGKDVVDATTGGIVGMARNHQKPVLALDVTKRPWSENIVRNWQPTSSELAVPLLDLTRSEDDSRRVVGVLNIESPRGFDFDESDITILELLAQVIFTAMHFRDIYRSKTILLRDITHAFEKVIWPLRVCAAGLRRRPFDPTQVGYEADKYKDKAAEIASLTDLAGNLLGWFQQLVKYEDSDAAIDPKPTSMMRLVQQIVERTSPFARNEDKQIQVVAPSADFEVACAADLVKAALFLLIENALTYSPKGDTVSVRLYQPPMGGARIEVIDNGMLVPFAERDFLFDAGFRGSNADITLTGGRAVGSGLGLDHVRRIVVKLHHGQVGYEELLEGKNVFYIQLPPGKTEEATP